ncbi:hypothetical protein PILCRDRAFT_93092 [Piloderma croceum F 1598]|uniref:Uncharacterized protein n=1 Tax=Piloderma croceum (strain F 1598) TaxID=765440 RepID=A0A0C3B7V7_PILCF|nr:hypothetical protein PILCRDRAFT_93092 [Piloderma croceum F 1598]
MPTKIGHKRLVALGSSKSANHAYQNRSQAVSSSRIIQICYAMSFPSEDYSGEYSYNARDDGYPQSETNSLIQDPLLLAMVPTRGTTAAFDVHGHGNLRSGAAMMLERQRTTGTQRNLVGAAVAPRQPNFEFGAFEAPPPHTQPSVQGSQSYGPLSAGSQFSTRPSSPMLELQESEMVPAKRRRTRNEGSRDGAQSDHSMASSQPPLLLSWGSQGAVASTATTPSITPNKDSQLYRLVVQRLFPSYHPDEMALINSPAIGEAVNEREVRTKSVSLHSGDKNRVFAALEDHKEQMTEVLTFKPNPKGPQKHGNDLLHMHLLSLYSRAFGPSRTKETIMAYMKSRLVQASFILLFLTIRKGYSQCLVDILFPELDRLPACAFTYNAVIVNNCSESYQSGIKVKCELEESAYASEVHSVQSAFDSIYYDDEFISFSNWLVRVNKANPTAPGQAVNQCTKQ